MFTVPAGNALVFADADGTPMDVPTTVPLSRTVTAATPRGTDV